MSYTIREATAQDMPQVLDLIQELAVADNPRIGQAIARRCAPIAGEEQGLESCRAGKLDRDHVRNAGRQKRAL